MLCNSPRNDEVILTGTEQFTSENLMIGKIHMRFFLFLCLIAITAHNAIAQDAEIITKYLLRELSKIFRNQYNTV